jgi:hypothetical protein
VRAGSSPDEAVALPALPDGGGCGERDGEVYARNRCVKPRKTSHQLEPGGSGLGAVLVCLSTGRASPVAATTAAAGGHGESLRRSRGDAAGV